MITRRQPLIASRSFTATPSASARRVRSGTYLESASAIRDFCAPAALPAAAVNAELVRYATLAPSSHNTQCWKFLATDSSSISIRPDFARRCPVVDPDDHHLFVSLGCATENLIQAATVFGLRAEHDFDPVTRAVDVSLKPTACAVSTLVGAIPLRQCTRGPYDGRPLSASELDKLTAAARSPQVRVILLTSTAAMDNLLQYAIEANTAQMQDPRFVAELKRWVRFSSAEAVRRGDGLSAVASGNPDVPEWVGRALFGMVVTAKSENDRIVRHLRSSAGVAVFVGEGAGPANWVEVGRSYERFALQATAIGIRTAFVNQPVEVASIRSQFARFLGIASLRPNLIVRFGRGPAMPYSLRRPVADVFERLPLGTARPLPQR